MTYLESVQLGKETVQYAYTWSLLIWVIPASIICLVFWRTKLLGRAQIRALTSNLVIISVMGLIMELICARFFFRFPNENAVVGLYFQGIPLEELLFYPTGFWFVLVLYVFLDEYFVKKYQRDGFEWVQQARARGESLYPKLGVVGVIAIVLLIAAEFGLKAWLNPEGSPIPGFMLFLTLSTVVPFFIFWRTTRHYMNFPALVITDLITVLLSLIWEVTLATPGGYWQYYEPYMVGIYIEPWGHLAIEAVMVWAFASLVAMTYEFTAVVIFRFGEEAEVKR